MSWDAQAGATAYQVERGTAATGPFTSAGTASTTAFTATGLTTNTTWYFRVRTVTASGTSGYSNVASATPLSGGGAPPPAPTGITVTPASSSAMNVSWTVVSPVEVEVERANAIGAPYVLIHTAAAGSTQFANTGLQPSWTYHYRARAKNADGVSDYSSSATATTQAASSPAAPTQLAVVHTAYDSTHTAMRLSWTDVANNETAYDVEMSTGGGAWTTQTLPPDSQRYVWPIMGGFNQAFDFRVRARNGSVPSAWVTVTGYSGATSTIFCGAPTSATASATSETNIRLSWNWAGNGCDQVAIERSANAAGPWVEIARAMWFFGSTPPAIYDDATVGAGSTWHYRLRSIHYNNFGIPSGPYSATVSATTPANLAAPTNLTVTVTSASTATLSWTDVATNETGYAIELGTAIGGPFTEVAQGAANLTAGGLQQLNVDTQYYARAVAVKGTLRAPGAATGFRTAKTMTLFVQQDATIVVSTAMPSRQNLAFPSGPNTVGCFYSAINDLNGFLYPFHDCGISLLRFDPAPIAGKTVLASVLVMYPCALAAGPVNDAVYEVRAISSTWNATTVTGNTAPTMQTAAGPALLAPTTNAASVFNVTAFVKNWATGAWPNHGLGVRQYPVAIDRIPPQNGAGARVQDQQTPYCSYEVYSGNTSFRPALLVDYL